VLMKLINGEVRGIVGKVRILPLVLMVLGCYGPMYQRPLAGDVDTKPADRVYEYTSESAWQRSGYWRLTDEPGVWPWFIVITGNLGCPSWDHELRVPARGEQYHCKTGWRVHRP